MTGERRGLVADALHEAAVAGDDVRVVVDELRAEAIAQHPLGDRHPDGVAEPLAERPGRRLDARRVAGLGVTGGPRLELPEGLDVRELEAVAAEVEHRVLEDRGVAVGQHEAVAVGPLGVGRVVLEDPAVEHVGEGGEGHGRALVAALGAQRGVHGEAADQGDRLSLDVGGERGWHRADPTQPDRGGSLGRQGATLAVMDDVAGTNGTALVTGGSRGIGAATAVALAAAGWNVAISYHRRADAAEAVIGAVTASGRRAVAVQADLAIADDVPRLFAAVDDALGGLDVLVNNAGIVSPAGPVASFSAERVERVMRLNVTAAFLAAGEAVRRMSTARGGRGGVIVNVSSRAAVLGSAGEYVDYAASKAALDALTVGLSQEVATEGIRVVGVRPGLIDTEIHAPGRLERLGATPPMGRPGRAEEVAAAIVWLASPAASYITGAMLDVGGGR